MCLKKDIQTLFSSKYLLTCIQTVIETCLEDGGAPLCIALADATGELLFFVRMPNAVPRAVAIAQNKARTSALMGISTRAFHERLRNEQLTLTDFCMPNLTTLSGGLPCFYDRHLIGGVGVSGRHPDQDEAVAQRLIEHLALCIPAADA